MVAVAGGVIIGHAMAADRAGSRGDRMTDIGVVVTDAWQGGGIGSALVRALVARARARGVTAMAMDVLPGNHQVLAMIARHWPAARTGHAPDYVSIEVRLQQARPGAREPKSWPAAARTSRCLAPRWTRW